jgi:hypothetical protein
VLANFTGADATATIGPGQTVPVADGAAISVRLKEGSYSVTMTPNCLDTFGVEPSVITVVRALTPTPAPDPPVPSTPSPSSGPSAWAGAGSPDSTDPSGVAPPVAGGPPAPGAVVPRLTAPGADGSDPDADGSDPDAVAGPDVQAAMAIRPGDQADARGARLLGLIAAICVFGVTSAIIRAIVAQRVTGALGS